MFVASLDVDGLGVLVQGPCTGEVAGTQTDTRQLQTHDFTKHGDEGKEIECDG